MNVARRLAVFANTNENVTRALVSRAKEIYIFVSFTGDDESWIKVTKPEILRHLAKVPDMNGELDANKILWISAK